MKIPIFQVDAFTNTLFKGNPAAVCSLPDWISDTDMQSIAEENNIAETAFVTKKDNNYHIRWFTPVTEVNLCGHATLAAAHVIFNYLEDELNQVEFISKSGNLTVLNEKDCYTLDFPKTEYTPVSMPKELIPILNELPV